MLSDALYRLRALFRRNAVEQELDEELSFHLEQQAEKYRRSGMAPAEVARRIRMEFGGAEQIREECRDARGTRWLEDCGQDLRYAGRTLRKNPLFTAAAVITLALGIGASTAIFCVTDGVMLKPLPYKDADRLVLACRDLPKRDVQDYPMSSLDFLDVRYGSREIFEDLAAIEVTGQNAVLPGADGMPEQVRVQRATANLLPMLNAPLSAGRNFEEADGEPAEDHPLAVMLSYEYWQRRYGGERAVVGTTIPMAESGATVVGVLAPRFELLLPPKMNIERSPDVWVAMPLNYDNGQRNGPSLQMVGRLRRGVSLDQARVGANAVAAKLEQEFPVKRASGFIIRVEPMGRSLVAEVRPVLLALMGAVIFLLLIACANVANLLLVRTSLRGRELAVRASLGGSLSRLMRQMLTEAVLLSALGSVLGVGLAWAGIHELQFLAPTTPGLATLPRLGSIVIDWRVLVFAALAGLASAAIYGLVPAWRASRPKVELVLRPNRRMGAGHGTLGGSRLFRNSVVAVEIALSFVLLVGSGLMFRSFLALRAIDPGFDPSHILTFRLSGGQGAVALQDLRARLSSLAGVQSVTSSNALPLAGGAPPLRWGGVNEDPSAMAGAADNQTVLPGYFETLGTKLMAGRTFTEADRVPASRLAVIDEVLAAKAFPGASPERTAVGRAILLGVDGVGVQFQVIGVVAHQRNTSLVESGREQLYRVNRDQVQGQWAVRTTEDPADLAGAVRVQIERSDPHLLITEMQPMLSFVDREQAKTRFSLLLLGVFAVIAALLAGVGIYGVLSALVRQQTKEIGLRMALGAAPASVFRFVAGQGLVLSAAGLAIGLAAGLALTRSIASMLVGVKPADPATFASMAALFLGIAFVASWLPAHRAANLDPAAALRED